MCALEFVCVCGGTREVAEKVLTSRKYFLNQPKSSYQPLLMIRKKTQKQK